jgi:hypothetical protein
MDGPGELGPGLRRAVERRSALPLLLPARAHDLQQEPHDSYEEDESLSVECSGDGAAWTTLYTYNEASGDFGPASVNLPLDASCLTGSAQVRFRAHGDYSWGINRWSVDDVTVGS